MAERGGFELDDDDETLVMKGGQPRRSGCSQKRSQTFKKYIVLEPEAALCNRRKIVLDYLLPFPNQH